MKKILSVIIVVIVILAGGWFVFVRGTTPRTEEKISSAMVGLIKASGGHFQLYVNTKSDPTATTAPSEINIIADGDFQKNSNGSLGLNSKITATGATTGVSVTGNGEARLVNGKLYYKFNEIPPIFTNLEAVRGKWLSGATNLQFLSEPSRTALVSVLQQPQLFVEIKQVGKEKVGNFKTTHFQAKFSPSGYASILEAMMQVFGSNVPVNKTALENSFKSHDNAPLDIWIDSANKLRKLAISYVNSQNKAKVNIEVLFTPLVGTPKIEEPVIETPTTK
jgi:hypothetical protein